METEYIKYIKDFIVEMIPNSNVYCKKININESDMISYKNKVLCNNGKPVYFEHDKDDREVTIFLENIAGSYIHQISIVRNIVPLSKIEMRVLALLINAIRSTNITTVDSKAYIPQIIEAKLSFGYFVIAQTMKGTNKSHWGAPIHYLQLLQQLTYQKYESHNCTSGFICVKNIRGFLQQLSKTVNYKYIPFDKTIKLTNSFFEKPASYRYVDGRNSFYLCSRNECVEGIVCFNYPQKYSIIDRCSGKHIEELLQMNFCKWIAYVGYNQDVVLYPRNYSQIKWEQNKWHLREKELIKERLITISWCNTDFASAITDVVMTLAELHMGSLILITSGKGPRNVGKIDTTTLGKELYFNIKREKYSELISSNRILGLLSSDGITVFNTEGEILDCGSIIDLSETIPKQVTGGGRTQAAAVASNHGIAIKVSEDGPISIFEKGVCVLSL